MGGKGSGRCCMDAQKATMDNCWSIDVRWLKRKGVLSPATEKLLPIPRHFWERDFKHAVLFCTFTENLDLKLRYQLKTEVDSRVSETFRIHVTTTPCNMGGERHWFLCPDCNRRVAILYSRGAMFSCRTCLTLAYPSQREDSADRAFRRIQKIRERLGWKAGFFNGREQQPKGMYFRTFMRFQTKYDAAETEALNGVQTKLGWLKK